MTCPLSPNSLIIVTQKLTHRSQLWRTICESMSDHGLAGLKYIWFTQINWLSKYHNWSPDAYMTSHNLSGVIDKVSSPRTDKKMRSVEYILHEISLRDVIALWSRSPNIDGHRGPCTGPVRSIMPRTAARAFYSRIMGIEELECLSLWRITR